MSSPIYIPDKSHPVCRVCQVDCSIEASSRTKYMRPVPRPTCKCPFGVHEDPINWIQ